MRKYMLNDLSLIIPTLKDIKSINEKKEPIEQDQRICIYTYISKDATKRNKYGNFDT